jgi:protoporphyrinogen oxidase
MAVPGEAAIIGAGPAGLSAAYRLIRNGVRPLVLERSDKVGGLARTECYKGYRFDIGGHRFFTDVEEVHLLWQQMLGSQFIRVPRKSRIYHHGRFFKYPLDTLNVLFNLGAVESLRVLLSYLEAHLWPHPEERTFSQWVTNRFGKRLYETFFKTYTEKVWGIPCEEIQAEWAEQRISGLSFKTALPSLFFAQNNLKTLIKEFHYPLLGPGMMWERFQQLIEKDGGQVRLNTEVIRANHRKSSVYSLTVRSGEEVTDIPSEVFVSSMPLAELVKLLHPPLPAKVVEAAGKLSYRAFVLVGLILDRKDLFADNWIYVHSQEVKVGRIQNYKNWSAARVPDPATTSLGMEYFCSKGDPVWTMPDRELIRLAARELEMLGLASASAVKDGLVFRQSHAYPVYDSEYCIHLATIRGCLETFTNLQTIGRSGVHRYNNMDHSMLMGIHAAENILGASHNPWEEDF